MKLYVLLALAIIPAFLIQCVPSPPPQSLFVSDGMIREGHYAVPERNSSGYSLYYGPITGDPSLVVRSRGELSAPFIVNPSRFLVVEQAEGKEPDFRLLEIDTSGTDVTCRRLVESKKYLGNPIVPTGTRSGDILFFTGDYHPEAAGPSVYEHQMAMLRRGKVSLFSGPTFLAIGQLAQIDDERFLAISPMIYFSDRPNVDLEDYSYVAGIRVDGVRIDAAPAGPFDRGEKSASSVTVLADHSVYFMRWASYEDGRQVHISSVRLADNAITDTALLPRGRFYSSLFAEPLGEGRYIARILSVDDDIEGRDGVFTISELSGGQLVNERVIRTSAGKAFDTESCLPAEVRF